MREEQPVVAIGGDGRNEFAKNWNTARTMEGPPIVSGRTFSFEVKVSV